MKQNHTTQAERATEQLDKIRELTLADLDAAAGGKGAKLSEACCHGTHIPRVTIELY
jgi:hypothetical protein